jgi:hypothetical protein
MGAGRSSAGAEPSWGASPTGVRASDAEREEYARIVRDAVGEGRLALHEGDERLAQIYGSKFRDELRPLVADLPGAKTEMPRRAVAGRTGLARHAAFVVVIAVVLTGIWAITASHFFWPAFPLIFLTLGLMRHASGYGWRRRRWYT